MSLPLRTLGTAAPLPVPALGLGCMGMSDVYGDASSRDDEASVATVRRALDLGVTLLVTADMYGPFTNERLVGRAIGGRRDEVVLATKFGNERLPDGTRVGINGSPEYVRRSCDASLQRLGVDRIDLDAAAGVLLEEDELAALDAAVPRDEVVGARYGDMSHIDA